MDASLPPQAEDDLAVLGLALALTRAPDGVVRGMVAARGLAPDPDPCTALLEREAANALVALRPFARLEIERLTADAGRSAIGRRLEALAAGDGDGERLPGWYLWLVAKAAGTGGAAHLWREERIRESAERALGEMERLGLSRTVQRLRDGAPVPHTVSAALLARVLVLTDEVRRLEDQVLRSWAESDSLRERMEEALQEAERLRRETVEALQAAGIAEAERPARPLEGWKVCVLGDPGRQEAYRGVVEGMGARMTFVEMFGSTVRVEQAALGADLVVLVVAYANHKASQKLRRVAAPVLHVRRAGSRALEQAIEDWLAGRGRRERADASARL